MAHDPGELHQCGICGTNRTYSYAFDSFFCAKCDLWITGKCGESSCIFCEGRKSKPSDNGLCKPKP